MPKPIKQLSRAEKRAVAIDRLKLEPALSDRSIARSLGLSPTYIGKIRAEIQAYPVSNGQAADHNWWEHKLFEKHPELLESLSERSIRAARYPGVLDYAYEKGLKSIVYAQTLMRRAEKEASKNSFMGLTEEDIQIFQGDVCTGLPQIASESVQLCFVDIPYHREAVETLCTEIAVTASRILTDGSSLLVMVGGAHLDIALAKLTTASKNLKFQWNISYICKRGTPLVQGRRVATAVKNIIWLVKGPAKYNGPIQYDLIEAPPYDGDKDPHYWGQSIQGVKSILSKFSVKGDTICDVMCGGGSTAIATIELGSGRKVIACDIDPEAIRITKQRAKEALTRKVSQINSTQSV